MAAGLIHLGHAVDNLRKRILWIGTEGRLAYFHEGRLGALREEGTRRAINTGDTFSALSEAGVAAHDQRPRHIGNLPHAGKGDTDYYLRLAIPAL